MSWNQAVPPGIGALVGAAVGAWANFLFNRKLEQDRRKGIEDDRRRRIQYETADLMQRRLVDTHGTIIVLRTEVAMLSGHMHDKETLVLGGRAALSVECRAVDPMAIEEERAVGRSIVDLAKELASQVDRVGKARDAAASWLLQRHLVLENASTPFRDLLLKQEDPVGDCKSLATAMLNGDWQEVCEVVDSKAPALVERLDAYALSLLTMSTALQRFLVGESIVEK